MEFNGFPIRRVKRIVFYNALFIGKKPTVCPVFKGYVGNLFRLKSTRFSRDAKTGDLLELAHKDFDRNLSIHRLPRMLKIGENYSTCPHYSRILPKCVINAFIYAQSISIRLTCGRAQVQALSC